MIIDTSILNTKYYQSIRGAIDFADRIKDSQEFLSEYFVEQFTKQISPKFAELLGVNITRLKRRDAEFLSDQYLGNSNIIFYNGVWYIKTLILLSNYGAYFWCICDSQEEFNPWNVDRDITLNFEIVFNIPIFLRVFNLILRAFSKDLLILSSSSLILILTQSIVTGLKYGLTSRSFSVLTTIF